MWYYIYYAYYTLHITHRKSLMTCFNAKWYVELLILPWSATVHNDLSPLGTLSPMICTHTLLMLSIVIRVRSLIKYVFHTLFGCRGKVVISKLQPSELIRSPCSEVNYCHFTFMMEESMKICTMPFYNVYIHKKLWAKDLLPSNLLFLGIFSKNFKI